MADNKVEINWDELDEQNNNKFKNYAANGEHKVKVDGVGIRDVQTSKGTQYILSFKFKETDTTKYPDASRWVFKDNVGFRQYHFRNLFIMLGCSEDGAKAAVVECESTGDYDKIADKYAKTLAQVANKYKHDVVIEVRDQVDRDGNYVVSAKTGVAYSESEFKNFDDNPKHGVYFSPTKPKQAAPENSLEDVPQDDEINPEDIPF